MVIMATSVLNTVLPPPPPDSVARGEVLRVMGCLMGIGLSFHLLTSRVARQVRLRRDGLYVRRAILPRRCFPGFYWDSRIRWRRVRRVRVETTTRARPRRSPLGRLARWVAGGGADLVFETRFGEVILPTIHTKAHIWKELRRWVPAAELERIELASNDSTTPTLL
jgi:hypothetical protein